MNPPPPTELAVEHRAHVEGFTRTLFWIFVVTSLAFVVAGMMWLL